MDRDPIASGRAVLPVRIALISDPHGDLVSLRAVAADIDGQADLAEVLVGGDLAQGGPQPAEAVDEVRNRGWPSVRGNADDFLVKVSDDESVDGTVHGLTGDALDTAKAVGRWSVARLGSERLDYLRSLPMVIERDSPIGRLVFVHATPWSTEEVVLPDAEPAVAHRMIEASGARVLAYGHIHTPYQRKIDNSVLISVGAIAGSNDEDPRPAYTIVELGTTVSVQVRRVECSPDERIAAYERNGLALSKERRAAMAQPGPFPVRSKPGIPVRMWP
jgi:predicted phosphodiesterase